MGLEKKVEQRLYTIRDAARYLGLTEWAVRGMISAGRLRVVRFGRRIMIDRKEIDDCIERNKEPLTP